MAASPNVINCDTHSPNEDWTVVLPRRGKKKRYMSKLTALEEQPKQWSPTELESNPSRESILLQRVQICIKKLESSQFYQTLVDQIQTPEILNQFYNVLGSELKMLIVIYGVGSIESYESSRLQLSLAVLLKRKFSWIGDIEVFDPILSATETNVMEALGCAVLLVNEYGRRSATMPTLFFMPHCEAELYENLLQTNWGNLLNKMVVLGNSFEMYEQHVSGFRNSAVADRTKFVRAVRRFTHEFKIDTVSVDYFAAFHDSSWHFFSGDPEKELHLIEIA